MVYSKSTDNNHEVKVIIFDWDDTICPSSFFDRYQIENINEIPARFRPIFDEVARTAEKCLKEASKYGEVIIITNSDDGWVNYSCERIVPSLLPVLSDYRIVSARTSYEKFYPNQPLCWKAAAFAHEVNEIFEEAKAVLSGENNKNDASLTIEKDGNSSPCPSLELSVVSSEDSMDEIQPIDELQQPEVRMKREIISFGDSMEERTAVRIVADQLDATPKSVMFVQSPTPIQIIGQLHMLHNHMKFVCDNTDCLDLEISQEQAQRCAESYLKKTASCSPKVKQDNIITLSAELTKLVRHRRRRTSSAASSSTHSSHSQTEEHDDDMVIETGSPTVVN